MFRKTTIFILLILMSLSSVLLAETQVFPLQDLNKPGRLLYLDESRLYVIENFSILIYSTKDYKLLKKFGKMGQGPQEFASNPQMGMLGGLFLDVSGKDLMVKSLGKVSWFTKEGEYIKETKLPNPFIMTMYILGDKYVGQKFEAGSTRFDVLTTFDQKFEETKEIARHESPFQLGKGTKVMEYNPTQAVYKNMLFTAWENDLKIKVYDQNLKELFTISHTLKRHAIPEKDKEDIIQFLKTGPDTKQYFEFMKPITFPDVYPAIMALMVSGDQVYVLTFDTEKVNDELQKFKVLIFDLKGKFQKSVMIPIAMQDPIQNYPFTIYNNKIYQLIENMDEESWEVHITEIK